MHSHNMHRCVYEEFAILLIAQDFAMHSKKLYAIAKSQVEFVVGNRGRDGEKQCLKISHNPMSLVTLLHAQSSDERQPVFSGYS